MYPKRKRNLTHHDPDMVCRGMRGNVVTFAISQQDIIHMLCGGLFPRPLAVLSSIIAISFIGLMKLEDVKKNWLKRMFSVRRTTVWNALHWLKENNRFYHDIVLDDQAFYSRIGSLPEDEIPPEILASIRYEDRTIGVDLEDDHYNPDREEPGTTLDIDQDAVVPLRSVGVEDADLTRATNAEIMMHALARLDDHREEGGYAVRHSAAMINDFGKPQDGGVRTEKNPLAAAFISLFPYGEGGPEDEREKDVSFKEHMRWTLRYHDRRFRHHNSWIFVAFGIVQKREALLSAKIQMDRHDFIAASTQLASITIDDLKKAGEEEECRQRPSNPAIVTLRKQLRAVSARVMGSDAARVGLRNHIWGTTFYLGPPSVWFTITPNDLHDPVLQVFAGEDIDMDNFLPTAGPDHNRRALNVARDPYAAAKFFQYIMLAFLHCFFGAQSEHGNRKSVTSQGGRRLAKMTTVSIDPTVGILGEIKAFFAPVETQGKSTLHSHFIIWLANAPSASEMKDLLRDGHFRAKMEAYLDAIIRADIPEIRPHNIQHVMAEPECSYSRPCNPKDESYMIDSRRLETKVARTLQLHTCSTDTCLVDHGNGRQRCKRRAPFTLSNKTRVNESGDWCITRYHPFLNGWNPCIARAMRCNHDLKLLTNGEDTKDLAFYIANYAAKKQGRSYNMMGLLPSKLLYHFQDNAHIGDIRNRNRLMLYRCFNVLNREQEKSASQCVMYLMGWGDVWQSHGYVPLYWNSVMGELYREFPEMSSDFR
ncbi:hypothetical protein CALVIDRAFT_487772 [Calocera viscosa TUFC12733]|uniref:Uncharacterized protein n=1 Tax=Calocera viscosa (strain TUFC12733) TaxID=1330018 RepID=A0A167I4Q2_CALVF|nr:hypothetical protein CALVIDRAFT_487772 [Calocera viscosa TUFC12733]